VDEFDGYRWDDDQLMTLLTEVLDPEADRPGAPASAVRDDRPAELSLEDVVAAGRAAFCWLDAVVTVRELARHLGPAAGTSTACEPATSSAASSPGSTATEGR
jgi:hypothetical protein